MPDSFRASHALSERSTTRNGVRLNFRVRNETGCFPYPYGRRANLFYFYVLCELLRPNGWGFVGKFAGHCLPYPHRLVHTATTRYPYGLTGYFHTSPYGLSLTAVTRSLYHKLNLRLFFKSLTERK